VEPRKAQDIVEWFEANGFGATIEGEGPSLFVVAALDDPGPERVSDFLILCLRLHEDKGVVLNILEQGLGKVRVTLKDPAQGVVV